MDGESTSSDVGTCGKTQLDTWDIRVCKKYFTSRCEEGDNCSLKHCLSIHDVVCRYFLLYNRCQKGPKCPFLHEVISSKLPECKNQTVNSKCSNPTCKFKHTADKESRECIYYNLGFCQMGKFCKFKHQRRELCSQDSIVDECKDIKCKKHHLRLEEASYNLQAMFESQIEACFYRCHTSGKRGSYKDVYQLCFRCMQFGHHPSRCENPDKSVRIRCYRCMTYGHKSNDCTS